MFDIDAPPNTDKEHEQCAYHKKHWGEKGAKDWLRRHRADNYLSEHFTRLDKSQVSSKMCYSSGTVFYSRKNGATISEEDIGVLNHLSWGQATGVYDTKPGDTEVCIKFTCDSSG